MELQQSPLYARYVQTLHWRVVTIDGTNIFLRNIPFNGTFAKIQRPKKLPSLKKLIPILKTNGVSTVIAEAAAGQNPEQFHAWCNDLKKIVHITTIPYIPTKTILIDLKPSEEEIFHKFTEAKRRAVRRAQKNNVTIHESKNIDDLIKIKNKSAGFLGFLTTFGIKKLWPIFGQKNGAILLAQTAGGKTIGGVLLLFWENTAYYWIAGATHEGKKLFAPTLLVWEAIKI